MTGHSGSYSRSFNVEGMTCAHCVSHVETALRSVDGVDGAVVDLDAGTAVVSSSGPVDELNLIEAVDGAGYTLVREDSG